MNLTHHLHLLHLLLHHLQIHFHQILHFLDPIHLNFLDLSLYFILINLTKMNHLNSQYFQNYYLNLLFRLSLQSLWQQFSQFNFLFPSLNELSFFTLKKICTHLINFNSTKLFLIVPRLRPHFQKTRFHSHFLKKLFYFLFPQTKSFLTSKIFIPRPLSHHLSFTSALKAFTFSIFYSITLSIYLFFFFLKIKSLLSLLKLIIKSTKPIKLSTKSSNHFPNHLSTPNPHHTTPPHYLTCILNINIPFFKHSILYHLYILNNLNHRLNTSHIERCILFLNSNNLNK